MVTTTNNNNNNDVNNTSSTKTDDSNDDKNDNNIDNNIDDDEGLLKKYDVIICGTGLIQSILASALARCNQSVLHVDSDEYYGELDAVWTLPYLLTTKKNYNNNKQNNNNNNKTTRTSTNIDDFINDSTTSNNNSTIIKLHPDGSTHSLHIHTIKRHTWPVQINNVVVTPYGNGIVKSIIINKSYDDNNNYYKLVIKLYNWKLTDGTTPFVYIAIPSEYIINSNNNNNNILSINEEYLYKQHKIRTIQAYNASQVLDVYSRSLALDITPYLLYAAGPAVTGLLTSKVSDYIEFKSLESLLYYDNNTNNNNNNNTLSKVPCSKNDVFTSKLLSPMDKRRLMKFLQITYDYATAQLLLLEEEQQEQEQQQKKEQQQQKDSAGGPNNVPNSTEEDYVQTWNERYLNQGRSLSRPQNKAVPSTDLEQLQQYIASSSSMSFTQYLKDIQKLSPSLITLVRYALALETTTTTTTTTTNNTDNTIDTDDDNKNDDNNSSMSLQQGMKQLCAHMMSLGRFGGTAFLVPLYGSGELAQAFCRSGAVYGATYLLRRSPLGIIINNNTNNTNNNTIDDGGQRNNTSASVQAVILQGPRNDHNNNNNNKPPTQKAIQCTHVIVPDGALLNATASSSSPTTTRVLRRISIICGKPIVDENNNRQQRHVIIIPPKRLQNQPNTIHGLLLDETVNVTPHIPNGGSCSILHLTTTTTNNVNDNTIIDETMLDTAVQHILKNCNKDNNDKRSTDDEIIDEIFQVTFSYALTSSTKQDTTTNDDNNDFSNNNNVNGIHYIHRPRPGLVADDAFEQAKFIFKSICPNNEFLLLSDEMDKTIKDTLGEHIFDNNNEEDQEQLVLQSAIGIINQKENNNNNNNTISDTTTTAAADTTGANTTTEPVQ